MILFSIMVVGLDNLRLWVDHFPSWLCTLKIMLRSFLFNTVIFVLCILTIIKFTILCILQRVPQMNDDFVAKTIIGSVSVWGIIEIYHKFLMFDNKPVMNEVTLFTWIVGTKGISEQHGNSFLFQIICLGYYDMEWSTLNPRPQYDIMIRFILILIHNILIVPICIKRYRHEMDENNARNRYIQDQAASNMSKSLESFISNCLIMGILFISIFILNELA